MATTPLRSESPGFRLVASRRECLTLGTFVSVGFRGAFTRLYGRSAIGFAVVTIARIATSVRVGRSCEPTPLAAQIGNAISGERHLRYMKKK